MSKFVVVKYLDYEKKSYVFYNKYNLDVKEDDIVVVVSSVGKLGLAKVIEVIDEITVDNASKVKFVNKKAYILDVVDTEVLKEKQNREKKLVVALTKYKIDEKLTEDEKELLSEVTCEEVQSISKKYNLDISEEQSEIEKLIETLLGV